MKKTINCKILRVVGMLLFSCFFAGVCHHSVMAEGQSSIDVYSNIYNASSAIDAQFKYEVVPDAENPTGAVGEPTEFTIDFGGILPENNMTTLVYPLSFADVEYKTYGVYKYVISEVSSSNPDYKVSSEKYEIYVTYANDGLYVYQQARNLADDTKGNINFNHEPLYSYIRINLTVIGDDMDKQEYFRFKTYVDSLCIGCMYDMIGQDEYVNYNGETIKTNDKYTVSGSQAVGNHVKYAVQKNDDKKTFRRAVSNGGDATRRNATYVADVPNYVYLKDGQSVTIGLGHDGIEQIPVGTLVRVIGDENLNVRKWTMYIDGIETREFEHYVGKNIDFDIVLERNMLVPNTGLSAEVLPFVVLIGVGVVGVFFLVRAKVRNAR